MPWFDFLLKEWRINTHRNYSQKRVPLPDTKPAIRRHCGAINKWQGSALFISFHSFSTTNMAVQISQILSAKPPLGHIHIHQHHKVRPVLILFYGHGIFHPAYSSITSSIDLMGFLIFSLFSSNTLLFGLSSSFSNLSVYNLLVL